MLDYQPINPVARPARGWSFWLIFVIAGIIGLPITGFLDVFAHVQLKGIEDGGEAIVFAALLLPISGLILTLTSAHRPLTAIAVAALPMPVLLLTIVLGATIYRSLLS